MNKKYFVLFVIAMAALQACSPPQPQSQTDPAPPAASQAGLPRSEAEVPRVSVADAKAALDRGDAIIVDVRDLASYERSHIAGALSIQLGEIETNAAGLDLDKDQWIITYCT